MFGSIDEIPSDLRLDIVSLFHVFEHLSKPLEYLKKIKSTLKKSGKIIIEVPHANDALISLFDLKEFKDFTFWSEHLILHTRNSLELYLKAAGFTNIIISGFQRYPLANHLHWLSKKKSGGHVTMAYLQSQNLNSAYADILNSIDKTDTLIAIAENQD
jgi:SAM-dependent methyltransferase